MPFQKTNLSTKELSVINKRIHHALLLTLLFFIFTLLTSLLLHYFYINNYEKHFLIINSIFTITFILICFHLLLKVLKLRKDIKNNLKLVGSALIIGKNYTRDKRNKRVKYYIVFNETVIGKRYVSYQFWKKIEIGHTFNIHQLPNSRFILNFESENINYLNELIQDLNLQNY